MLHLLQQNLQKVCWRFSYLLCEHFVKHSKWFAIVQESISYDLFYIICFLHPKTWNKICFSCLIKKKKKEKPSPNLRKYLQKLTTICDHTCQAFPQWSWLPNKLQASFPSIVYLDLSYWPWHLSSGRPDTGPQSVLIVESIIFIPACLMRSCIFLIPTWVGRCIFHRTWSPSVSGSMTL